MVGYLLMFNSSAFHFHDVNLIVCLAGRFFLSQGDYSIVSDYYLFFSSQLASYMKNSMLSRLVKRLASTIGGCASKPKRKNNGHKRKTRKSRKRGRSISTSLPDMALKRLSNAGNPVRDFSLSDFVNPDFDKGASATSRRSEVSNMKFHLNKLQYHNHSQIDANGIFSLPLSL